MKQTAEEIRVELLKDMEEGYCIPEEESAAFLKARLKARKFCEKKIRDHHFRLSGASILVSEYKALCKEALFNHGLYWVTRDLYELGYYRGYQRAIKEAREAKKDN